MKQEILLVKIHNGLKDGKSAYEATRKHWRMNTARYKYIKYVVGLDKRNVVAVFEPSDWFVVSEGSEKGRSFFEGREADGEILEKIKESSEVLSSKFGSGAAIAYISLANLES